MDLTVRPLEERDLPACLALLRGRSAYPDDVLAVLPRAWRRLLREDALVARVVEVGSARGATTLVCFGASVFVTDAWMAAARSGVEPFLTARTIRAELAGPTPVLRPSALRPSNDAEGLNVLILHYGEARELAAEARPALRRRIFEAFVEMHRGYRIKEILQEFWDEIDPEYVERGWGRVLTDYAPFFARRAEVPQLTSRPRLVGVTRADVLDNPGALAAPLFLHTPPRFSFTRAEQRMLAAALAGETDVQLARSLGLAIPTVKSRWRGIYDRVDGVAPALLAEAALSRPSGPLRGKEKRRRLLEYLRRHSEELRPGLRRGGSSLKS